MIETRYQRIAREQRERQAARQKRYDESLKKARKPRKKIEARNDDPLDNKDNLGESPDY
jgi:hypothetical protein